MDALKRCGRPNGAVIYIARIGRNGRVAMAKPCGRCQKLLIDSGIKRVVYSINATDFGIWPPEFS